MNYPIQLGNDAGKGRDERRKKGAAARSSLYDRFNHIADMKWLKRVANTDLERFRKPTIYLNQDTGTGFYNIFDPI